jgi:hypothetical protein
LTEENARLNLEVGALINENRTARMQAEVAAEKIRMFANQAGEVVAKAELFDENVEIGSKPSGTRIALILTDYSEKLEGILVEMREVVKQISDLRKQPKRPDLGASCSSPFQPFTSGDVQWSPVNGGIDRHRCDAGIQDRLWTNTLTEGQESSKED